MSRAKNHMTPFIWGICGIILFTSAIAGALILFVNHDRSSLSLVLIGFVAGYCAARSRR